MQFVSITVGDHNLIFPDHVTVVKDFTFPQSATAANAVVQGFDLLYNDPDHFIHHIEVSLVTHFHSGDRAGTVEVSFALRDDANFEIIGGQIKVLVIGTP